MQTGVFHKLDVDSSFGFHCTESLCGNALPFMVDSILKYIFCLARNEKEGIPPDMLQQLDVCVEIPQQGIIRSLNVHVSGALLVWEYTRQQMELSDAE